MFLKKDELQKLTKAQLKVIAKKHHIKMNSKQARKKSDLIETILYFQDFARNVEADEEEPPCTIN